MRKLSPKSKDDWPKAILLARVELECGPLLPMAWHPRSQPHASLPESDLEARSLYSSENGNDFILIANKSLLSLRDWNWYLVD